MIVGGAPSLTLRIVDNLEGALAVGMDGDTLRIGLKPRTTVNNATLQADLTVVSLDAIEGSGAVDIHLASVNGSTFDLQLSGASTIDGGPVEFESMNGEMSGASDVTLSGRVGAMDIDASGASNLSLLDLAVTQLKVSLSGASDAEVRVARLDRGEPFGRFDSRLPRGPRRYDSGCLRIVQHRSNNGTRLAIRPTGDDLVGPPSALLTITGWLLCAQIVVRRPGMTPGFARRAVPGLHAIALDAAPWSNRELVSAHPAAPPWPMPRFRP